MADDADEPASAEAAAMTADPVSWLQIEQGWNVIASTASS